MTMSRHRHRYRSSRDNRYLPCSVRRPLYRCFQYIPHFYKDAPYPCKELPPLFLPDILFYFLHCHTQFRFPEPYIHSHLHLTKSDNLFHLSSYIPFRPALPKGLRRGAPCRPKYKPFRNEGFADHCPLRSPDQSYKRNRPAYQSPE